jgi:hypothetical protein
VLADALRVRILEAFCLEERTTKQVAALLGEKPTRLYHHVEALERVGLIRLTRTRQNRGTIEKYYLSVARQFRADSSMFGAGPGPGEAMTEFVSTIMDNTAGELRRLFRFVGDPTGVPADSRQRAVVGYLELHATEAENRELQDKLQALLDELTDLSQRSPPPDSRRHRLTLLYFPLDVEGAGTED